MGILNHLFYWAVIIISSIGVVVYWTYVREWEDWYPIVGVFIAAHGGLAGGIAHYIGRWKREK